VFPPYPGHGFFSLCRPFLTCQSVSQRWYDRPRQQQQKQRATATPASWKRWQLWQPLKLLMMSAALLPYPHLLGRRGSKRGFWAGCCCQRVFIIISVIQPWDGITWDGMVWYGHGDGDGDGDGDGEKPLLA